MTVHLGTYCCCGSVAQLRPQWVPTLSGMLRDWSTPALTWFYLVILCTCVEVRSAAFSVCGTDILSCTHHATTYHHMQCKFHYCAQRSVRLSLVCRWQLTAAAVLCDVTAQLHQLSAVAIPQAQLNMLAACFDTLF